MKEKIAVKTGMFLIMSILILSGMASNAHAFAIGASPATISFSLARGESQEKTFEASTNSDIPLGFTVIIDTPLKEMIEVSPAEGTMSLGSPGQMTITASAARSAKPGDYSGAITIRTKPAKSAEGDSGSKVSTGVAVKINIKITEETTPLYKSTTFLIFLGAFAFLIGLMFIRFYILKKR